MNDVENWPLHEWSPQKVFLPRPVKGLFSSTFQLFLSAHIAGWNNYISLLIPKRNAISPTYRTPLYLQWLAEFNCSSVLLFLSFIP